MDERPPVARTIAAERDWPRMDPPNVLWFVGTFAIEFGVYGLIETIPGSQDGLWRLVTAVAFFVAFVVASAVLLRRAWWVPGGLAAALAVGVFPAVAVGFLQLVDVWPSKEFFEPFDEFSGYWFGVAIATALVGLAAYALVRFPFILGVAIGIFIVATQLLVPSFEDGPSGDDRTAMALVIGALLVVVGVFLDVFARRREAFWFHVLGLLTVAGGLTWLTEEQGNPDRGWVPMLIAAAVLLVVAGPVRRATWAVYGVLGFYAAVTHYLLKGLDEDRWPFALLLLALGLTIFAGGMATHRHGRTWARRFMRRPPPTLTS